MRIMFRGAGLEKASALILYCLPLFSGAVCGIMYFAVHGSAGTGSATSYIACVLGDDDGGCCCWG